MIIAKKAAKMVGKPLKKLVKKTPGNTLVKKQLTGKAMLTKAMQPFGK